MGRTKIEWATDSWTPIRARRISVHGPSASVGWHCEKVSTGCEHCYSETMNKRLGTGLDFMPGNRDKIELFLDEKMLLAPLSWRKPRMIFVCSMSDLFAEFVPDEWIDRIFAVMALCPQHTFQVLTKRQARMRHYFTYICNRDDLIADHALAASGWPKNAHQDKTKEKRRALMVRVRNQLPNVLAGTSCEDQETAAARIPDLLATPAAVRFVSCEPLLKPIRLREHLGDDWLASGKSGERKGLDWVICGSESGPHARPCDLSWVRSLRDQCSAAGVSFFWKQHAENGRKIPTPELDGKRWVEFPCFGEFARS